MNSYKLFALLGSLALGIPVGIWLLPGVAFWKIILLLGIPLVVFLIAGNLGGSAKLPSKLTAGHAETINHLLKNIEEGNWEEKQREFTELKKSNPRLANQLLKIQQIYQANKQFTQNAAHELQTPLAIIKGHAELLLQSPSLSEKEAEAIGAILHNINRLSRLNSALILLSKIDHRRFHDESPTYFNEIIDETLDHFSDMIELQKIKVEKNIPLNLSRT